MTTRLVWFPAKKSAWNEGNHKQWAITKKLPAVCMTKSNQDNFMQSVINFEIAPHKSSSLGRNLHMSSQFFDFIINDFIDTLIRAELLIWCTT